MHVLIVTNHFYPEVFRINDLAFGLAEKGHQVSVLTGLPNYPAGRIFPGYGVFRRRKEMVNGVSVRRVPLIPRGKGRGLNLIFNYLSSAFFMCTLAPFLCRKKYDVIFVFETSPATIGLPAVILRRLRKIPVVFWVLDLWPESLSATGAIKNKRMLGLVKRVVRFIYARCDRILVSSRGFEQSIRAIGGYQGSIDYFPNWIEPTPSCEPHGQPDLPALPEGFRLVFTGNIGKAQNFEALLDAAAMLKTCQDIHWIIVGDGREYNQVSEQVRQRGLSSCFHLMGRYPFESMEYFMESASALLLPLRDEPIFALTAPGKTQPYLASGKPVIAALNGEAADIVERAGAGIACGAENPAGLRDAILQLYQMTPAERDLMGASGKRYAFENFDRDNLFDQLEQCLIEVKKNYESH